MLDKFKEKETG